MKPRYQVRGGWASARKADSWCMIASSTGTGTFQRRLAALASGYQSSYSLNMAQASLILRGGAVAQAASRSSRMPVPPVVQRPAGVRSDARAWRAIQGNFLSIGVRAAARLQEKNHTQ